MSTRTKPELAMNYSRTEGGLAIRLDGATVAEGQALSAALVDSGLLAYLERQGYNPNSLRFSIRKKGTS